VQSNNLQAALLEWTAKNSGHVVNRQYIGLSGMGDCDRVIYERFVNGVQHSKSERIQDAYSFEVEAAIICRLDAMGLYQPAPVISLYGGLIKGHTDGLVGGDLLEIKTVRLAAHFPEFPRLPNRVYIQVQAYMQYAGLERAHVIYVARESGDLRVIGCTYNPRVGERIKLRVENLVMCVHEKRIPECSCGGRCQQTQAGQAEGVDHVYAA
jgi:hypothetical protein